ESGTVNEQDAEENFRFAYKPQPEQRREEPRPRPEGQRPAANVPEPKAPEIKVEPAAIAVSRPERDHESRVLDRRHAESHPHRRSTDRGEDERIRTAEKPRDKELHRPAKSQNPVWDSVAKLSQDRLESELKRTNSALESIGKSLQQSIISAKPESVKPMPKPDSQAKPAPSKPAASPKLPSNYDSNLPPKNVQSHLTMLDPREHPAVKEALKKVPKVNKLDPGNKVQF
ncbi:MAG: hypothetical protein ACM3KM_03930, partial [Acidobacteriaceae bacterium]